jgi:hypothetical protein
MRSLLFLYFYIMTLLVVKAQSNEVTPAFNRKGFTFGLSAGAGILSMKTNGTEHTSFAATLPNFRIGYMIHNRLAIQMLQPGSPYRHENKDRVFEAFLLSAQYWVKDRIWVSGGAGMTFDAPAFWTLPGLKNPEFNIGFPAFAIAAGYEIKRWKNFTADIQYRFFYGKADLPDNGHRTGFSHMISVGLNLY